MFCLGRFLAMLQAAVVVTIPSRCLCGHSWGLQMPPHSTSSTGSSLKPLLSQSQAPFASQAETITHCLLPTPPNLHSLPTHPCSFPPSQPKTMPLKTIPVPTFPTSLVHEPPIAEIVCMRGPQPLLISEAANSPLTLCHVTETRTIAPHKCNRISGNHNSSAHSVARQENPDFPEEVAYIRQKYPGVSGGAMLPVPSHPPVSTLPKTIPLPN